MTTPRPHDELSALAAWLADRQTVVRVTPHHRPSLETVCLTLALSFAAGVWLGLWLATELAP